MNHADAAVKQDVAIDVMILDTTVRGACADRIDDAAQRAVAWGVRDKVFARVILGLDTVTDDLRAGILATAKELRHTDLTEDAAAKLR